MDKIRVLLVEDMNMHRALFEMVIRDSGRYTLVASTNDADLAEAYCERYDPKLILMDVLTYRGASGLDASARIKKRFPKVKIIIITSMPEHSYLSRARQIGVDSFWYKEVSQEPILELMDRTMAGESVYPDQTPAVQIGLAQGWEFTRREKEVLRELIEGSSNQMIAEKLGISVNAVHHHVKNMLEKTGYNSRVKLAVMVRKSGLVINHDEDKME